MSGGQVTSVGVGDIIRGEFVEGDTLTLRAYVANKNGGPLLSSECTAGQVSLFVYQTSGATPTTAVYTNLLVGPSNGLISTLSTTGWLRGGTGYNFEYTLPATSFEPSGGITYRFEFIIATTSGQTIVVFELLCKGVAIH